VFRSLVAATVLAAIPTTAAAATRPHGTPSIHVAFMRAAMTGEIRQLDTKRILVGTIGCSIPAKVAVSADRFVVGDPVKITCVNGVLRTVKYSPEADPGATYSTHPNSPPTVATVTSPGAPFTPSTAKSAIYSIHTLSLTSGSSVSPTQTATGTISALSPDGITVGDLTCSFFGGLYELVSNVARVGDNATLTCDATSGRLVTALGSR
jgi:hypothetical protein